MAATQSVAQVHISAVTASQAIRMNKKEDGPSQDDNAIRPRAGGFWNRACGCDRHLDHDATSAAVNALIGAVQSYEDPGRPILPHESIIERNHNVMAFIVNNDDRKGDRTLRITADEVQRAFEHITNNCGLFVAGTTGAENTFAIGYMLDSDGEDLVNSMWRSEADKC
ncbi:uncharacterized protein B0I36DRAFT_356818 [Microdochium trichocladiopsis]|uniref:Uncharacterized protein n=1 Tax=Microdochium trichocladiopsis TaxID=1682393 RepID=A0A9P9BGZ1_9PEZI|nr:uncharacterized protein B0I36DRAFT_356818 [Microdochium trichocladiopsis]KAH7009097.1 hypothetical protein B0I36DRAFT_356818 [Microdochium trichocladiopsis]